MLRRLPEALGALDAVVSLLSCTRGEPHVCGTANAGSDATACSFRTQNSSNSSSGGSSSSNDAKSSPPKPSSSEATLWDSWISLLSDYAPVVRALLLAAPMLTGVRYLQLNIFVRASLSTIRGSLNFLCRSVYGEKQLLFWENKSRVSATCSMRFDFMFCSTSSRCCRIRRICTMRPSSPSAAADPTCSQTALVHLPLLHLV